MSQQDQIDDLPEDDFMREFLTALEGDHSEPPVELSDRTIRKVRAQLTGRDLIDLTTIVFIMRFCAPLLDLLAAFFGHNPVAHDDDSRPQNESRSQSENTR